MPSPDLDRQFMETQLRNIFLSDGPLRSMCGTQAKAFWPDEKSAAQLASTRVVAALREGRPLSLLRVGNGEGNAISMTKEKLHPLQVATFYREFVSQNGISVPQDAAIGFCRNVKSALTSADILGFRSFRFDERALIETSIEELDSYAALGFLYAREFLQDGFKEGRWLRTVITSAWIHLDLIPFLDEIMTAAESIVVITGRDQLHDAVRSRVGSRLRDFIAIPVQGFQPPSLEDSHFCRAYPAVCERLRRDMTGTLVLVGAGLFGKIYCHIAQQNGAVAVDLGSAFDVLCGLNTRPVHQLYDIATMRWLTPT
jgi:hypothetical protein